MRPYALLYTSTGPAARPRRPGDARRRLGVAVAVALVFAALVANGSIAGSAAEVVHTVIGPASLQLRARGREGFDERLLPAVGRLPGVKQAAPLLEQTRRSRAARPRVAVDLAGTDVSLAILDGLAHTLPLATLQPGGIALTRTTRRANSGVAYRPRDQPRLAEPARQARPAAGRSGPRRGRGRRALSGVRRVMPLTSLQQLAGLPGRSRASWSRPSQATRPGARRASRILATGGSRSRPPTRISRCCARRCARATRPARSSPRSRGCWASCSRSTRCC